VAAERGLPEDWLNDGVKDSVSARHETGTQDLPQFDGLRVTAPTPEYLLAMKCMASRVAAGPDDPGDVQDIRFLVKRLGLASDHTGAVHRRALLPGRAYSASHTVPA
jgi:hypothetical protein